MSLRTKIGLVVGLGYAIVALITGSVSLFHPLVGVLVALFMTLWELQEVSVATKESSEISAKVASDLSAELSEILALARSVPCTVAQDFPAFVTTIRQTLQGADQFYNNTRAIHHSGEIPEEGQYFKLYRSRALGNNLSMKRLIHLGSRPALEQAKARIGELSGANRFEMRVWTRGPFPLTYELMLADHSVVIAFANAANEPDLCLQVNDRRFAKRMNEYFLLNLWQAPGVEVIKEMGKMEPEEKVTALKRLDELYQEQSGEEGSLED